MRCLPLIAIVLMTVLAVGGSRSVADEAKARRLLYVAEPGIRNYVEYGGHGILVYDIDAGHAFVKRIPMPGLAENGKPLNVKGVCANAKTKRIYVSTLRHLICLDLVTEQVVWEKTFPQGADRMSMTPDGSVIYLPSLENDHWYVVDAETGEEISRISPKSRSHNTVVSPDGKFAYLAGLKSPLLTVVDTRTHKTIKTVGPFSHSIRPFTVNGSNTLCFVNVNELLGFEVGDLQTGKMLHRVEVEGFEQGKVKRHGCPSHGIGMTPDETEIWVADGANNHVHVFDATVMPPKQVASIELRGQPGWVTFSLDGRLAYPSTGEVIDVKTRKIVARLADEEGRMVMSEKLLEIDFEGDQPVRAGDQFGVGQLRPAAKMKWERGEEVSLFDGETLNGWVTGDGEPVTEGWDVSEGAIHRASKGGHIYFEQEFGSFELRFEWKIVEKTNSGLKYRVAKYGKQWLGCEFQIYDEQNSRALPSKGSTGSLYALYAPNEDKSVQPIGTYNTSRIVVRGTQFEHWLNGKRIVVADTASAEWYKRVRQSKFHKYDGFARNPLGRLMLQDHGGEVWFRGIVLTPLTGVEK